MISIGDTREQGVLWSNFKVNKENGNVVLNVTIGAVATGARPNRSLAGCHKRGGRPTEDKRSEMLEALQLRANCRFGKK